MLQSNIRQIRFNKDSFFPHEQAVLSSLTCPGFLPVTFLRRKNDLIAEYDCSGYAPLSSFRIERTEDVLYLLEETLRILHRAPEYLLDPRRIILRTETVFYDREGCRLRIAFLPQKPSASGLQKELLLYLAQLEQDLPRDRAGLIDTLAQEICRRCLNTSDTLRIVGVMRRQLDEEQLGGVTGAGSRTSDA